MAEIAWRWKRGRYDKLKSRPQGQKEVEIMKQPFLEVPSVTDGWALILSPRKRSSSRQIVSSRRKR